MSRYASDPPAWCRGGRAGNGHRMSPNLSSAKAPLYRLATVRAVGRFPHCRARYHRQRCALRLPWRPDMQTLAPVTNRQVRLAARPVGLPTRANWDFTTELLSEPAEGGVLVRTLFLSLDPAMRGWMN